MLNSEQILVEQREMYFEKGRFMVGHGHGSELIRNGIIDCQGMFFTKAANPDAPMECLIGHFKGESIYG